MKAQHTETIQITPASLKEYPVIQNMARFYFYDFSEFMGHKAGWGIPEDGLYECMSFKHYWEAKNTYPYLIRCHGELAGFAIVDDKGSDSSINYNLAQFFILRKFKNKGIGTYVAHQIFNLHLGTWEVMVIPENTGAFKFWTSAISSYTDEYVTYDKTVPHLENSERNIFRFDSVL